ncbi:MAG: PAS domain S-box protein [Deltaproteobacteria bacterium]|nr:PAS domain S-box protein [Deltaproteobacteria bacterium]
MFNDMLTDLVKSWSALQESERRYRNVFDDASEGIFQSTIEGVFLNVNPALKHMLCLDEDAGATFSNLREQLYVNPEDRDRMISRLLQEEKVDNYEVQMRRADGHTFWVSINCHLVRGEEEQVLFIEGTVDDISQRRQAEESLLELKEYLHDIVDVMPSILIGAVT